MPFNHTDISQSLYQASDDFMNGRRPEAIPIPSSYWLPPMMSWDHPQYIFDSFLTWTGFHKRRLSRAPLGYFYNTPHLEQGGGVITAPLLSDISETMGPIFKTQTSFDNPVKFAEQNLAFIDLGITDDATDQVKVKNIDNWACSHFDG